MHPAYSVIFFTSATGAGYGLLALFGITAAFDLLPTDRDFAITGAVVGYFLIVGGLLSSTFHLGRPERAWRALTQWRSSWLSREGILAIATFGPTGLFLFGWVVLGDSGGIYAFAGLIGAVLCGSTVHATSMIYRSLRSVRAWRNPWVTPGYFAWSLVTGALLANALTHGFGVMLNFDLVAMAGLILAAVVKAGFWRSIDAQGGDSTPESATGLGHLGAVRLLDPPHTGSNFLMAEMGYVVARRHATKLRRIVYVAGLAVPFVLTVVAMLSTGLLPAVSATLAVLPAAIGVLVERWLFFAEAKHTVMLYYGANEV